MGVTINVNGLSLVHKKSGGIVRATLPDVCKTPPAKYAPLPYPNIAFSKDLAKGTTTVKADGGAMCANRGSEFAKSIGDEPGSGGGVKSGVHLHKATWLSWSPNVYLEGKAACRLTDKMLMNKGNTVSVGGEQQKWLGGNDPLMDKLCEFACACRGAARRQACMAEKIAEDGYTGDYPGTGSQVWKEVSMEVVNGAWQIIQNRAGTGPTSNPITPRGGIRPDVVLTDGAGRPTHMVEVKFEGDTPNSNQQPGGKYDDAADDLGLERRDLDVEEDCDCGDGGGDGPTPVPVPVPVPHTQSQPEEPPIAGPRPIPVPEPIRTPVPIIPPSPAPVPVAAANGGGWGWVKWVAGGVVAVAVVACVVAEPCGAAVFGGAALTGGVVVAGAG